MEKREKTIQAVPIFLIISYFIISLKGLFEYQAGVSI